MTLKLPATLDIVLRDVITPSLALLPSAMASDGALISAAADIAKTGLTLFTSADHVRHQGPVTARSVPDPS